MRITKLIIALAVLSLALMGWNCKEDEESAVIPEKYVGTWKASNQLEGSSIVFAPVANPDQGIPLHTLGATIEVTLTRDGNYNLTLFNPIDQSEITDIGKATINEDNKTITMDTFIHLLFNRRIALFVIRAFLTIITCENEFHPRAAAV